MKGSSLRVAIIGAGPVGLEAALYAKSLGLVVTVYERGQPGGHLDRWGFLRMFTPFGLNHTPLGRAALLRDQPDRELPADTDLLTGREFKNDYLVPLVGTSTLRGVVQPDTRILSIGRTGWRKTDSEAGKLPPFRLLVRAGNGAERFDTADVVLDCTGTLHAPNWAGDGGLPAAGEIAARPQLSYWVDDVRETRRAVYANKTVVVIGGGYSAATVVCDLAELAQKEQSTWVVWLTHGPRTAPLPRIPNDPLKERDRLAARINHLAARCDGNLEYHPQTAVDEIVSHGPDKGFRVSGRVNGTLTTWEAERMFACVGYRPDWSIATELRVGEPAAGEIATGEPGYFVLGQKSAGRTGDFLLNDGHNQIKRTFAIIQRQPGLDLYTGSRRAA